MINLGSNFFHACVVFGLARAGLVCFNEAAKTLYVSMSKRLDGPTPDAARTRNIPEVEKTSSPARFSEVFMNLLWKTKYVSI